MVFEAIPDEINLSTINKVGLQLPNGTIPVPMCKARRLIFSPYIKLFIANNLLLLLLKL